MMAKRGFAMIIDEIKKANIEAMKAHDSNRRNAYAMVISRYQEMKTNGSGKEVGDAEVIRILQKFSKELEEEKKGYEAAGREESARNTQEQLKAVSAFLPKMMGEDEIAEVIASLQDKSIPSVMKHFKENYAGKADMGLVSKIARGL